MPQETLPHQVSITMNRDFSAPLVAFTSTDFNINLANQNSYSLEGTCDLNYSVNLIIGSLPREPLNCSNNGTWELTNKNVSTLPDGTCDYNSSRAAKFLLRGL